MSAIRLYRQANNEVLLNHYNACTANKGHNNPIPFSIEEQYLNIELISIKTPEVAFSSLELLLNTEVKAHSGHRKNIPTVKTSCIGRTVKNQLKGPLKWL